MCLCHAPIGSVGCQSITLKYDYLSTINVLYSEDDTLSCADIECNLILTQIKYLKVRVGCFRDCTVRTQECRFDEILLEASLHTTPTFDKYEYKSFLA